MIPQIHQEWCLRHDTGPGCPSKMKLGRSYVRNKQTSHQVLIWVWDGMGQDSKWFTQTNTWFTTKTCQFWGSIGTSCLTHTHLFLNIRKMTPTRSLSLKKQHDCHTKPGFCWKNLWINLLRKMSLRPQSAKQMAPKISPSSSMQLPCKHDLDTFSASKWYG